MSLARDLFSIAQRAPPVTNPSLIEPLALEEQKAARVEVKVNPRPLTRIVAPNISTIESAYKIKNSRDKRALYVAFDLSHGKQHCLFAADRPRINPNNYVATLRECINFLETPIGGAGVGAASISSSMCNLNNKLLEQKEPALWTVVSI